MKIKEMRFSLWDFALVTQKRMLKDYNVSVGQFFGLNEDSPIPCGAVYELALINPQATKFVLVCDLKRVALCKTSRAMRWVFALTVHKCQKN